ncbi:hypothetical protein B0H34DRAFT_185003 [Crassisporium funariophilum]|nr:hypothetical protein B0H34DRAFT_185003 [Crassisporium funariophilum]
MLVPNPISGVGPSIIVSWLGNLINEATAMVDTCRAHNTQYVQGMHYLRGEIPSIAHPRFGWRVQRNFPASGCFLPFSRVDWHTASSHKQGHSTIWNSYLTALTSWCGIFAVHVHGPKHARTSSIPSNLGTAMNACIAGSEMGQCMPSDASTLSLLSAIPCFFFSTGPFTTKKCSFPAKQALPPYRHRVLITVQRLKYRFRQCITVLPQLSRGKAFGHPMHNSIGCTQIHSYDDLNPDEVYDFSPSHGSIYTLDGSVDGIVSTTHPEPRLRFSRINQMKSGSAWRVILQNLNIHSIGRYALHITNSCIDIVTSMLSSSLYCGHVLSQVASRVQLLNRDNTFPLHF